MGWEPGQLARRGWIGSPGLPMPVAWSTETERRNGVLGVAGVGDGADQSRRTMN